MKIATWNINSLRIRLPHVLDWLDQHKPDILCLQETKVPDKDFPLAEIEAAGFHVLYSGQKTFNGVAIISREPLTDVQIDNPLFDDHQKRVLCATWQGVRIINVYVPNGESVVSEKYAYKLKWLEALLQYVKEQLLLYPELVVLGDFNIAPADQDVYDPLLWAGQVLCTEPEREHFQALLDLGLSDCFRLQPQPLSSFSWWDYRANGYARNLGVRIDHVLASEALAARCMRCGIDKAPRELERPSDHAPVFAEFVT